MKTIGLTANPRMRTLRRLMDLMYIRDMVDAGVVDGLFVNTLEKMLDDNAENIDKLWNAMQPHMARIAKQLEKVENEQDKRSQRFSS